MTVLAVDLAARYSAACVMTRDGEVLMEWDSASCTDETDWVNTLVVHCAHQQPDVMVVEDLPHRLPHSTLTKAVTRLQGRIYHAMHAAGYADKVLFLAPATWRNTYPYLRKHGLGAEGVVKVATELGYTPPSLKHLVGARGGKALANKVLSDYCAAFLIGRWAIKQRQTFDTYDVPGTARYGQQQMRKPKSEK